MNAGANVYVHASRGFIQKIRQNSQPAALYLEEIQRDYGAYPAFLAAFALTVLMDRHTRQRLSSSTEALKRFAFYDEMRDTTGAIRLYQEAARQLFMDEGSKTR
ncbi:MAG: hypothetical protein GC204_14035 [Chloroflexi bacterium]|nr:hypothetical protein [Chloroflexota bacterium]